jgi:hypothetical protein
MPQNHNRGFPHGPRNKPQLKATWKRKANCGAWGGQADSLQGPGVRSAWLRRTVRKSCPNNQYCTSKNGRSVRYQRTVRPARTVGQPWADSPENHFRLKTPNDKDRMRGAQEQLAGRHRARPLEEVYITPKTMANGTHHPLNYETG